MLSAAPHGGSGGTAAGVAVPPCGDEGASASAPGSTRSVDWTISGSSLEVVQPETANAPVAARRSGTSEIRTTLRIDRRAKATVVLAFASDALPQRSW